MLGKRVEAGEEKTGRQGAATRKPTENDQSVSPQRLPSSVEQGRGQFQDVELWRRKLTGRQRDEVGGREDEMLPAQWLVASCSSPCSWLSPLVAPLQPPPPPCAWKGLLATLVGASWLGGSGMSSKDALSPRFSSQERRPGLQPAPALLRRHLLALNTQLRQTFAPSCSSCCFQLSHNCCSVDLPTNLSLINQMSQLSAL